MTFIEATQHARLVLAGILLFVIAYQLWIARVRPSEPVLYLVAAWAGAALLMVAGRSVQHATDQTATVLLGVRIYHTGVFSLVPLGFAVVHEVRAVPRRRLFWICTAASLVPVPLVWLGHLIISDRVRVFQTLAGPILGPEPTQLAPAAIPYLVMISAYLLYVARQGRQYLPWHQRCSFYVAVAALLPALVNDVLLYSGTVVTIELVGVALFAHIMAINVGIFARAGELFATLEKTVEERTTELRAREQDLSQMLAVRRRILDAIPDVICLLQGRRFDYVNDAGEGFFGKSSRDLRGMPFTNFVVEGQLVDAERCLSMVEGSSGPTVPVDLRFVGASGTERTAEVAGLVLELGDGPRTLVTVRDVTERKQLQAQLQVADRLASVGTLAAGVAHEINNPLTYILGSIELIQAAIDGSPTAAGLDRNAVRKYLDDCTTGTQRIAQIVRDLLVFTRTDNERAAVDCRATLEHALKMAMVTIRHRAEVTVDYGPTPPVSGDSRRLSQVFLNLLVNAFQSIPDDGERHSIHVSTKTRADGWAVVEIADTGVGIDPKLLQSVFDPFVTTKPVGQGTGLGLFICEGIVTELGGEIRLLPGERAGTTARVALPPAEEAPTPTPEATRESQTSHPGRRIHVLIADDDELVLDVLTRLLESHEVTAVKGGAEAIRALEVTSYDIILCDLMMPRCDGAEVWEKAKELGLADRFVLLTGGAMTDAHRAFIESRQVPVVTKPASRSKIEAAFDACLGTH